MKFRVRATVMAISVTLLLAPAPSAAIAPLILLFGKQMIKDMLVSQLKSSLLNSLRDMGCKGVALANALTALDGVPTGRGLPLGMPAIA